MNTPTLFLLLALLTLTLASDPAPNPTSPCPCTCTTETEAKSQCLQPGNEICKTLACHEQDTDKKGMTCCDVQQVDDADLPEEVRAQLEKMKNGGFSEDELPEGWAETEVGEGDLPEGVHVDGGGEGKCGA